MHCSRPRGSQIGAVVSHQSSVLPHGQQELEQREQDLQQVATIANALYTQACSLTHSRCANSRMFASCSIHLDRSHLECSQILSCLHAQ